MYRLKALLRCGHDSFLNVPLNAAQHASNDSGINVNSTKADTGSDIHVEGVGQLGNADNTTKNIRVVHVVIEGTDDEHNEKLMNSLDAANMVKGRYGLEKLMKSDDGVYLFKFSFKSGMEQVLERGPWMIRKSPIILNKWSSSMSLKKGEVTKVSVWVKMHNVPLLAYSKDRLSLIATQIGKPIMLDVFTSSMCVESWGRIGFARALIEPTIDKASIMDKFVSTKNSFDALMDSNNSFRANKANKQTSSEWSEDIESDDEVDEVLYPKGNKFEDQFDIRLKSRVRK
nr:hypothetical protein [Tanacetum cinerariifolium]